MAKKVRSKAGSKPNNKKAKVATATKDRPDLDDDADGRVGGSKDVESEDESDPEEVLSSEDEEEDALKGGMVELEEDEGSLESDHGSDVEMDGGDDDDDDDENAEEATASLALSSGVDPSLVLPSPPSTGAYVNKQRCLVLCTRGVTSRHRHLLEDLRKLIPHMKKVRFVDCKRCWLLLPAPKLS